MNLMGRPETKIELPAYRKLCIADDNDRKTLETFEQEPMVEVYCEPDNGRDYFISNADGSITRVAECININGTQWIIPVQVPIKIPQSVYQHWMACQEQMKRAHQVMSGQCISVI